MERKKLSIRLELKTYDKLKRESEITRESMNKIVTELIEKYIIEDL